VTIYYAEYYALYSFLTRIGVKCGNHFCSILIATYLLGKKIANTIFEHKEKRIDAQYYLRTVNENKIRNMLNSAKIFVPNFDEIIIGLNEKKVEEFRKKIMHVLE